MLHVTIVVSALSRLLARVGLESGERRVFVWGTATFFLMGWASVSLTNVGDTLFLKRVGVELLPAVFLGSSFLLVATTFVVAWVAARTAPVPLLRRTFFVLGASLLPLWVLVLADLRGAFVLLVIAAKQFDAVAAMLFWVALGGQLHGRQAKRLYAPIVAGGTLGEMLGSFASASVGQHLGMAALLLVAAAAFGAAGLLAVPLRSGVPAALLRVPERRPAPRAAEAAPTMRSLWRESQLFRYLVAGALLCGMLGPMLYFQFSYAADLATQGSGGEQRLLGLYARFRGYLNVGVLALQLVGTARIFRRIGVPLAATLSPLVYLLGFLGVSAGLGLPAAVAAMAAATLQDHAIYDPANKILVALFPERVRAAATSFIEGPIQRIGGTAGNALVLCVLVLGTPAWAGAAGLPIAAAWLAVAIALWRVYPTLLLEVASARRSPLEEALARPELVDPATLRVLEASLVDADLRRCRAASALVVDAPPARAVRVLARAVRRAPAANRPALIDALHRVLDPGGRVRLWVPEASLDLEAALDAPDLPPVCRARLIQAYASVVPNLRPGSHAAQVLAGFLDHPAECVRLAALTRVPAAAGAPDLDAALAAAVRSDDAAVRQVALDELRTALLAMNGAAPIHPRLGLLAAALETPRDRGRAAAIFADVAARHGARVADSGDLLLAHAGDPDPRVRAAVLRFVGHARLEQHVARVVERLTAGDDDEAAAAHEAVRVLGPAAMNALLDALRGGPRATRHAVLAILREMSVDEAILRGLIQREVDGIWRVVLQLYGLRAGRVSDLVLQRLGERVDEGLQTTLLLLATLLHEERLAEIGRLLPRAGGGRQRALLLEALEALLPPDEREWFRPLLEDVNSVRLAASAADALGRRLPSFPDAVRDALADPDALTRTLLAASFHPDRSVAPAVAEGGDLRDDRGDGDDTAERRMLGRMEVVLHLRSLELFARLTTPQLTHLAEVVREVRHPAGVAIVREGDFEDGMYLIVSGEVSVSRQGRFLARVGPREFFGEMALFDGQTRAATVTAETPVHLLRLERHDLFQVMDEEPGIAIAICQTLSRRVRDLIERMRPVDG